MSVRWKEIGAAGASSGWRQTVAERVARPLSRRTGARHDEIRAALGLVFIGLSVLYLARTARRFAQQA